MKKADISRYCYSLRIKDITLGFLNILTRFEDYYHGNANPPNHQTVLTWILESQLSQINEIISNKQNYPDLEDIYSELEKINNLIHELGENINFKVLQEKVRKVSIKNMNNLAKISEKNEV
ncbi:MAG: hypothetical protein EU549_00070 [Promethearchaeota archaeon]|nr:MAG: hypothetical protein EU549_00070 [Candidatus Lokiarchaeota archaeon]